MKNHKRMLSLVLVLVMALALLPTAALAADITVTEVGPGYYGEVHDFSEGLAAVQPKGKWGFVDKTGKEAIPCKYDEAKDFSEGLAAVRLENKWGFIDKTGKETVPCKYWVTKDFSDGLAAVQLALDYLWGFVDKAGQEVIPCKYYLAKDFSEGLAAVCDENGWGFIDKTGAEVIPCKYTDARPFSEGLAAVMDQNYKWGFIDTIGKEVIPCKYDTNGRDELKFSEGLAAVYGDSGQIKRGESVRAWGFIDKTGNEVIPCKYDWVGDFSEDLAAVKLDGKWGLIDKTGKEVVPCTLNYTSVDGFHEGLAAVNASRYDSWGFIDKTGKEVIPCKYSNYGGTEFHEGFAVFQVEARGRYGLIDKTGKEVVPCKYNNVGRVSEGLAAVETEDGWGFISLSGVTTPAVPQNTAYASTQTVNVDGKAVTFECYALKGANGNATNYIKLRDLALLLNGSAAQFQVGWDGTVTITTKTAYTPNGSELKTPYSGDRTYQETNAATKINGVAADLAAFVLNDDQGGGYTYYQLRDLGKALGFNVGWAADKGIFVETDKPYDANN